LKKNLLLTTIFMMPWTYALFVWLISHQTAVLFSQNKSATGNQPTIFFLSEQISTSHQPPPAKRTGC
jgi:hypothetical protein